MPFAFHQRYYNPKPGLAVSQSVEKPLNVATSIGLIFGQYTKGTGGLEDESDGVLFRLHDIYISH